MPPIEDTQIHLLPLTPAQVALLLFAAQDVVQLRLDFNEFIRSHSEKSSSKYATIREAAKLLRVSERSVRSYLKAKRFSYVCSGNRKLLLLSELDAYMHENHYATQNR